MARVCSLRTAGIGHGVVVGIEGLGDKYLIAVIQDAVHGDLQSLRAAVGDQDVTGVEVHIQVGIVLADGLHQLGDAGGRGVGQHRQVKVPDSVKVGLGCLDVRLADVQMVDLLALGLGRHRVGVELAHGRQSALQDFAGKLHDGSSLPFVILSSSVP